MATKQERAVAIYKAAHAKGVSNKEIVKKIMKDLHMSEAGARTYAYNAKKALKIVDVKSTKTKVAKTKVKASVDKKTGKLTVTKTVSGETKSVAGSDQRKAENEKLFDQFNKEKVASL